jgi:hypothetical protein
VAADVHKLKRRFDSLKADRATFESHWQEIAEVITPRKAEFVGMRSPGDKRMSQVYDETGIHALELLTAGLHGMATNPAAKWFSLRSVDDAINEQDSVKKYLADLEQIMWARMYAPGTGITTALNEIYADLGAFGTASLFITTRDDGGLLFQARHLGETLIAENSEGTVDTVFRCIRMTVRQMAQEFGLDACSEKVREAFRDEKYETYFDVVHAVCPRNEREYDKKDKANQPFASVYFEPAEMHLIEEGGFPEFPYACPRWSRHPGETYGRSPGMTALPAVKMLQASELATIKAMQKCVDPPLFLPDDGFLGPIRTVPGGLNFFRGNREIFPLPTPDKLPITLEWQESLRNRIRTIFFTDVLQFVADREMTATEVMQRTSERMRLLGPIMGRLESELLGPMIERVFGILERAGMTPDVPEEMDGHPLRVEYVSPIASAQRQTEANGMMQVLQYMAALGPEAALPIVGKNLSGDRLFRYLWDLFNNDPDLLTSDEEREAMAKQEQAMQAAQTGVPMADMAQKGAGAIKSLSDAQASGGIDLNQLIGEMGKSMRNGEANGTAKRLAEGFQ